MPARGRQCQSGPAPDSTLGIRACPNPPPGALRWSPNIASIRSIAIVDGTCRVGRVSHSGSDRAQSAIRAPQRGTPVAFRDNELAFCDTHAAKRGTRLAFHDNVVAFRDAPAPLRGIVVAYCDSGLAFCDTLAPKRGIDAGQSGNDGTAAFERRCRLVACQPLWAARPPILAARQRRQLTDEAQQANPRLNRADGATQAGARYTSTFSERSGDTSANTAGFATRSMKVSSGATACI